MKNQSILFSLLIFIISANISCKKPNKKELNTKHIAQLELDNQNMKLGKAESDYYYGIGSRFEPITKTDLANTLTIYPFNRGHENESIKRVNSTEIIIIKNDRQTDRREYGFSENLTEVQKTLLKSLNYSENFSIRTNFQEKGNKSIQLEEKKFNPHYTVTPEKQALYVEGEDAILNYLIINSKIETANLDNKKVRPAKIYFTITHDGSIKNVRTDRTTGYPILDKKLKTLISKIPGAWEPAKNNNGELIEQELAFTFGAKGGC